MRKQKPGIISRAFQRKDISPRQVALGWLNAHGIDVGPQKPMGIFVAIKIPIVRWVFFNAREDDIKVRADGLDGWEFGRGRLRRRLP